jgi:pepF/M3 family oligoendopeptidase
MTQTLEKPLPKWNTTAFYPDLESDAFKRDFAGVFTRLDELEALFERHDIQKLEVAPQNAQVAFDEIAPKYNAHFEHLKLVGSYIQLFITTNARDNAAQAKMSELQAAYVRGGKLGTRFEAWIGSLNLEPLISGSEIAKAHEFALRKMAKGATHQMSPIEEDLSASLTPTGRSAWGRLHGNITSRLMVNVKLPDGEQDLPMSAVRGLARDADAQKRAAAYAAEVPAWETVSVPLAAAMNSIKGEVGVLNKRRGYQDALEPTLEFANMDRATLEAMHAACVASFPDFRRYFHAKAKLLGYSGGLKWHDLFAPVGNSAKAWNWDEGSDFIATQFGTYSKRLEDFARRSFTENWTDAEPRAGKRDGAFCMGVRGDESRILMNFTPSLDSLSTLAHELGHGYHNINLAQRTPLQRQTPMTLAETASIFCETIVSNAALAQTTDRLEKIHILETELQGQAQVVVDIHSRFLFESHVFKMREQRELSVEELCAAMLEGQRASYGDGLDDSTLHPYMWAMKPHYYGSSFYNYPYTFGLLFGLGLYAQYQNDPENFKANYDDLLSSTGMFDAATLAGRFGFDIRSEGFWTSSLDQIRARIDEFVALVG